MKAFERSMLEGEVHVKSWCLEIEESAWDQVANLASLPFAFHHVAIMPDCHSGYGMPIGGVLAAKDVVIPNAVGVDIGCGMRAVQFKVPVREINKDSLKKVMGNIRKVIPMGFEKHKHKPIGYDMPLFDNNSDEEYTIIKQEYSNAEKQLGTLGGGNHFIEFQEDEEGMLWVMVHSGSRNLGKKVADYYNKIAVEMNEKWYSQVPKEWQLAFLPRASESGLNYVKEMEYCVEFANNNRFFMAIAIATELNEEFGYDIYSMFDVSHNYARIENHFGHNVTVHRKGATSARKDEAGIIPGSMGTNSYIVKGLGNPDSFMSCSHGAGRVMSRTRAKAILNLEQEQEKMEGVIHGLRNKGDLDEAPGSYKDIDEVMAAQDDLVEIVHTLKPIANIKG